MQQILEKKRREIAEVAGPVKSIVVLDSQIYAIYKHPATIFDVFCLKGRRILRVDIAKIIQEKLSKSIKLKKLDHVLIPVLRWSGRRNKLPRSFGNQRQQFDASKVILTGKVAHETKNGVELLSCIMVFNLLEMTVEKFKILAFMKSDVTVTCVAYGPFDNGHILLGLSDGWLLAYEFPSLERLDSKEVYTADITSDQPNVLFDIHSLGASVLSSADSELDRDQTEQSEEDEVSKISLQDRLVFEKKEDKNKTPTVQTP